MNFRVPFFRHDLGSAEVSALAEVLAGNILTTGETVATFEKQFAEYLGASQAVGLNSCTAALHLSLAAMDIGPGDEVITTPMTFIATATSIIQAGATPVFVDVEPSTGNIDHTLIEQAITPRTKAIMPVHLYGLMCDMRALRTIADRHHLKIVEDCAHCIEGARDGVRPGQLGDTACFSFYATKNMTCGEGGALVTNSAEIAARVRLMRVHGMDKTAADRERSGYSHWDMPIFGWKYNMDNIQAALLLPQMLRLEHNLARRHVLAEYYAEQLVAANTVSLFSTPGNTRHARHLFPVLVPAHKRDAVVAGLSARGIGTVVNYRPVHLYKYFRETFGYQPERYPAAEDIGARVLSLPLFPALDKKQVEEVVEALCASLNDA